LSRIPFWRSRRSPNILRLFALGCQHRQQAQIGQFGAGSTAPGSGQAGQLGHEILEMHRTRAWRDGAGHGLAAWDFGPYPVIVCAGSLGAMFVGDEMRLGVGFDAAQAGLANLAHGGPLLAVSAEAYGEGLAGLALVGPLGSVRGMSRLVEVRFLDLVIRDEAAVLTLRWEAIGAGGRLFPALDADITLTPAGEHATLLRLAGAYRPPLGSVGAGIDRVILHRVAAAAIGAFMNRVADAVTQAPRVAGTPTGVAETLAGNKGQHDSSQQDLAGPGTGVHDGALGSA
jgi:hypothetical protein